MSLQVLESGAITESAYEHYLEEMSRLGHWGDGIAGNLYGRPMAVR
jgi:hypothetical protein